MSDRPDYLTSHAREILGMPHDWRMYRWECVATGILVHGAVANEKYTKGKYKGFTNWRKKDRATDAAVTITDAAHRAWLENWEKTTGHCYECGGTTQAWAGWSRDEGVKYKPCKRCDATGMALGKPATVTLSVQRPRRTSIG